MKHWLYILLTITLFTSCMYEAMYFLTDKDLEWMASYEQGDTVLFLSSNEIDTMTIDEITLYNDDNPWRENEGTSTFMGNSSFKYTIKHHGEMINGKFLIVKEDSLKMSIAIRLYRRHMSLIDEKELQLCSRSIGGTQYDNLIEVNDSNSELYTKDPFNTEYFIWSKSKGLLQYKYLNGDVYTFYKKIPRKK
ncbi:MAG: hypothetical protein ACI3ZJ_11895 [Bacteroidaceae bacterium]